jgi:hypothetical protein
MKEVIHLSTTNMWWAISINQNGGNPNGMECKGILKIVSLSSMPNSTTYLAPDGCSLKTILELIDQELFLKVLV